jgi:uncharacterized damage-inducible protein DinB
MDVESEEQRVIHGPAGYEPVIARWVWAIEDTRQRTKASLVGLTDAVVNWVAPQGGNTIGMLLYHLLIIEMSYLYEDIREIGWAAELEPLLPYDVRDGQGRLATFADESLATHLQRLDSGRALLLDTLRQMTVNDFFRPRTVAGVEVTPEWVLHHLMQHEAEHRGQIGEIRNQAEKALAQ